MNDRNAFALVPKPPGSLEKAEPGARHILSGMVLHAPPTQYVKTMG